MDLHKAYQTLGLSRGATRDEIEAAYGELRDELDARIERVAVSAVEARYRDLRERLDVARELLLSAPAAPRDESLEHAFVVLGLPAGASALDVASAYVSLCETIEREARDAPTDELRRACLEARADVDAAYQRCTAPSLGDASPTDPNESARSSDAAEGVRPEPRYETQMSSAPFEAVAEPLDTARLQIDPEPDPEEVRLARRSRRRRRVLGWAAAWLLLLGGVGGLAWQRGWLGPETLHQVASQEFVVNYLPKSLRAQLRTGPDPALIEAQTSAEYLRTRVAEERRSLLDRIRESVERTRALEARWTASNDPNVREQIGSDLARVRARRALSATLSELAEQHVFGSPAVAEAIGKIERANELMGTGDERDAIAAFREAQSGLESALLRLDAAEEAVGARSEAEAGLAAWRALADSAGLEELAPALEGHRVLEEGLSRVEEGDFEAGAPALRRAAQQYASAVLEGRKLAPDPPVDEEGENRPFAQGTLPEGSSEFSAVLADMRAVPSPPVAAAASDLARSAIKLVLVPSGDFFFGCREGERCDAAELPGQTVSLPAFRIDRTEVRVSEFRECVASGTCTSPSSVDGCNWNLPDRGDHPVNCVDWNQARDYCRWVGKRLPNELEWEKAARGSDARIFPWGDNGANCDQVVFAASGRAGCGADSTWPVASRSLGRSPFGLFDMAGNVLEWTSDVAGNGTEERVARGGSWRSPARPVRTSSRDWLPATMRDPSVGFRCAQDVNRVTASTVR